MFSALKNLPCHTDENLWLWVEGAGYYGWGFFFEKNVYNYNIKVGENSGALNPHIKMAHWPWLNLNEDLGDLGQAAR